MTGVEHFPGLTPFDTLRTHAAARGHITTTWFATASPPAEVSLWYEQRLLDHTVQAPGDWTRVEVRDGLRRLHGVTVHPPEALPAGPRPTAPVPPATRTVVRVDEGAFPTTTASVQPVVHLSLLQRIKARLTTLR
ncbi:hypothetical protein GCM10009827_024600 [Dactylosporangium maewongense]|uniref:Uncharacterized protein n=1 Tax=Dactylosporangium maewongense TaxID=634393 RepID=A0ABN2A2Y2_9ACTN